MRIYIYDNLESTSGKICPPSKRYGSIGVDSSSPAICPRRKHPNRFQTVNSESAGAGGRREEEKRDYCLPLGLLFSFSNKIKHRITSTSKLEATTKQK